MKSLKRLKNWTVNEINFSSWTHLIRPVKLSPWKISSISNILERLQDGIFRSSVYLRALRGQNWMKKSINLKLLKKKISPSIYLLVSFTWDVLQSLFMFINDSLETKLRAFAQQQMCCFAVKNIKLVFNQAIEKFFWRRKVWDWIFMAMMKFVGDSVVEFIRKSLLKTLVAKRQKELVGLVRR